MRARDGGAPGSTAAARVLQCTGCRRCANAAPAAASRSMAINGISPAFQSMKRRPACCLYHLARDPGRLGSTCRQLGALGGPQRCQNRYSATIHTCCRDCVLPEHSPARSPSSPGGARAALPPCFPPAAGDRLMPTSSKIHLQQGKCLHMAEPLTRPAKGRPVGGAERCTSQRAFPSLSNGRRDGQAVPVGTVVVHRARRQADKSGKEGRFVCRTLYCHLRRGGRRQRRANCEHHTRPLHLRLTGQGRP